MGQTVVEIREVLLVEHTLSTDAHGNITWRGAEQDYWRAQPARLKAPTILDPARGSGHFLVAAFDWLADATRAANDRLREVDAFAGEDTAAAKAHIITRCLYGVDLNTESVEIIKLSLWLKTAQPRQALTTLDGRH